MLKEKRFELGLTQDEMAVAIGMKPRMYAYYEKGDFDKSGTIKKRKYLLRLAELPQQVNKSAQQDVVNGVGNIIHVPLIAYGGFLQGYSNKVYLDSLMRFTLPGVAGEHYAFEVDGMSMFDLAAPGDTAIAKPEERLEWMMKGKTYVLQTTDGILIKQFEGIRGEKATFNSYNQEYLPIDIPLKSIKRVYYVTRILKKL